MKFLPVKEGNAAILMRLPVRRLSLKVYIENTMIPDIIAYEGSEFLSSLFGSSRKVRETNREEPNEHKEETVISVAISKALGNFNLVIESLKFTC